MSVLDSIRSYLFTQSNKWLSAESHLLAQAVGEDVNWLLDQVSLVQAVSSSCGSFSATSTGLGNLVDVTNLTVTFTGTGRPLEFVLISDGSGNPSIFSAFEPTAVAGAPGVELQVTNSSNAAYSVSRFGAQGDIGLPIDGSTNIFKFPCSAFKGSLPPVTGSVTLKVRITAPLDHVMHVDYAKLLVYER